jgi:acetyl-CoA/propionyl-CoA carboxylase biotin carboxyl carrier protein
VREQFRLAQGGRVDRELPAPRGHAIEFRINAEDAACGFLPAPGVITRWRPPEGPGVRVDSGVDVGTEIGAAFDSMLAKLIVTGADRRQAIERARRALAEFEVDGVPTVLPFHRAVLTDPAFVEPPESGGFTVHTRWIETEFDNRLAHYAASVGSTATADGGRSTVTVEVGARRVEVSLPAHLFAAGPPAPTGAPRQRARRSAVAVGAQDPDSPLLASPMHGSVVRVAVSCEQQVARGDLIAVLEAMKMEQPVTAHRAGVVVALPVRPGDTVSLGDAICEIHPTGEAG